MHGHDHFTGALLHAERRLVPAHRSSRALAAVLVGLFLAVAASLALAPWQQSAAGSGRVVAYAPVERQQAIEAPIEGRVMHWHVREGSRVRKGDKVAEIVDNDAELMARLEKERDAVAARIEAARARAEAIEARVGSLGRSRQAALSAAGSRARMAADRVRAAEQALSAAEAAERTAKLNHDRQQSLHAEGLAARRALELADLELVRTRTDADRARAALDAARREEHALSADRDRAANDGFASIDDARAARAAALTEVASATAELARIEVRLARQTAQSVTAPRDGTILRLVVGQGTEMVKAGDPIAILVPDTDARAVEIWLTGNDVPLVSEGRHVRLQFEGWPAVQFTGWPSVAVGTFGGRVAVVDAGDDGKGRFRALVVPDGDEPWPSARYLRQGTRAHGWVLLDRVSLGYELWRRFNGFPPSLTPDSAEAPSKGAKEGK